MSVAGVTGVLSWLRARPSDMATAPRPVAGAQAGGLGDARNGLFVYDRTALAQAIRFDDIPVLPACNSRPMIAEGGPVWPDWEGMGAMRHMRASEVKRVRANPEPERRRSTSSRSAVAR